MNSREMIIKKIEIARTRVERLTNNIKQENESGPRFNHHSSSLLAYEVDRLAKAVKELELIVYTK